MHAQSCLVLSYLCLLRKPLFVCCQLFPGIFCIIAAFLEPGIKPLTMTFPLTIIWWQAPASMQCWHWRPNSEQPWRSTSPSCSPRNFTQPASGSPRSSFWRKKELNELHRQCTTVQNSDSHGMSWQSVCICLSVCHDDNYTMPGPYT